MSRTHHEVIVDSDGAGLARLERDLGIILTQFSPYESTGVMLELSLDLALIRKLVEALRLARLTGQAVQ